MRRELYSLMCGQTTFTANLTDAAPCRVVLTSSGAFYRPIRSPDNNFAPKRGPPHLPTPPRPILIARRGATVAPPHFIGGRHADFLQADIGPPPPRRVKRGRSVLEFRHPGCEYLLTCHSPERSSQPVVQWRSPCSFPLHIPG